MNANRKVPRAVIVLVIIVIGLAAISGAGFLTHRALSAEGYACRIVTHMAGWGKSTRTVTHSETRYASWRDHAEGRSYVRTWSTKKTTKYGPSVMTIPGFALPQLETRAGSPSITYGIRYSAGVPLWEAHDTVVEGSKMEFRYDLIVSSMPDCAGKKEILPISTLDAIEIEKNDFGHWTPDYGSWLGWHFDSALGIEMGLEEVMIWLNWPPTY